MIAVIISEIAGWLKNESRTTISAVAISIGLTGSFVFLRPEVCLEVLTALILWIAVKAGEQNWSEFWIRDWVKRTGLSFRTVILGKISAALAVALIHLLLVMPVLIMMLILWGFAWRQLANVFLTILLMVLVAAGLGICGSGLRKEEDNLFINFPMIWIGITALTPILRMFNPFWMVWRIMAADSESLPAIFLSNFGLALAVFWLAEFLFRKVVR